MINFFVNRYYRVVERKVLSYTLIFSSVLALSYASLLSFYSLNQAAGLTVLSSFLYAALYLWLNASNKYFERKKHVILTVLLISLWSSYMLQGGVSQTAIFDFVSFMVICIFSNQGVQRRFWAGSVLISFGLCLGFELVFGIKSLNNLHYLPKETSLILVGLRAVFILYLVCLIKGVLEKYQKEIILVKSDNSRESGAPK